MSDDKAPKTVPATQQDDGKKKKKKSGKKQFTPLPVLEGPAAQSLPWRLAFSQKLGRHAVALRDLPPGSLLLRERAVATVVREDMAAQVCHHCFKQLAKLDHPPLTTPVNPHAQFCSQPCLDAEASTSCAPWLAEVHAKLAELGTKHDMAVPLLRIMVALEAQRRGDSKAADADADAAAAALEATSLSSGGSEASSLPVLAPGLADVEALLSHWDKQSEAWRKAITKGATDLLEGMKEAAGKSEGCPWVPSTAERLAVLAACVNSNAHGIFAPDAGDNQDRGLGLFPVLSMLNHSCRPNCAYYAQGPLMEVRCLRPLKAGEQLTVDYISLMEPRPLRQQQLLAQKFFKCGCERCSEPLDKSTDRFLEGFLCPSKGCHGVVVHRETQQQQQQQQEGAAAAAPAKEEGAQAEPAAAQEGEGAEASSKEAQAEKTMTATFECTDCKKRSVCSPGSKDPEDALALATEAYASLQQCLTAYRYARQQSPKLVLNMMEAHIKKWTGKLHPHHVALFDVLMPLVNIQRRLGDISGAQRSCQQVISTWEAVLGPQPHSELANFHVLLAEIIEAKMQQGRPGPGRSLLLKQAREALQRAHAMRVVLLGPEAPLTKEVAGLLETMRG